MTTNTKLLVGTGQDQKYLCVVMTAEGVYVEANTNIVKLAKNILIKF